MEHIADISVTFLGKIRNLIFQNSFWNFSIVNTIKCIFAVSLKFSRQVKVFRTGERSCVPSLRLSLLRESGTWLRTTVGVSSQTREVSSITQITLSPTAGPTKLCFFLSHHTVPIRFECGLVLAEAELDCVPWYLPQVLKMPSLFVKPVWLSTQPGIYYIDSLW